MSDIETVLYDLDEARGRIDTVRESLHLAVQGLGEEDAAPIRQLMANLERMAAEVGSVEETIAAHEEVAV